VEFGDAERGGGLYPYARTYDHSPSAIMFRASRGGRRMISTLGGCVHNVVGYRLAWHGVPGGTHRVSVAIFEVVWLAPFSPSCEYTGPKPDM
jgi:hypothetical protein